MAAGSRTPRARLPQRRKAARERRGGQTDGPSKEEVAVATGDAEPAGPRTLYVVATPLGNLRDITLRALDILGGVDVIAAEDTRVTAKLLARYGIRTPMISVHEHNEAKRAADIIALLVQGQSVALVSDAGTPAVSDPGA